jgi:Zn-dependent protease
MIWRLIRYVLILASAAFLIFMLYLISGDYHKYGRIRDDNFWASILIPAGLVLNLIYLIFATGAPTRPSPMMRLINLWFEAKEVELRKRIGKP